MEVRFEEAGTGRYILKVIGYACPFPTLYTLKALENVKSNEILEVLTDSKPSCETIPQAVISKGHRILKVEQIEHTLWKIIIEKG
ncbi:MAG: sulfurtransferase TusA family protein [Candidatus Methanomethylicaceae archaeon]